MLSFFRINDPYRLLVIFFLLLLLRVPVFISDALLTLPELNYMLVGERISGDSRLYADVWDSMPPLSALVYAFIDFLFGRSQLAYQIIAYILVCYQVFVFNTLLLRSKAYGENSYVPALIYGVLMTVCYDMVTLTPFLIGLTFILLALRNIFNHIEVRAKRDEDILNIGLFVGLATITYLPFAIFAICTLIIFVLFTGTVPRRYILMTFGFFLPFLISGSYYYLTDRLPEFLYNFFAPFSVIERVWYITLKDTLRLFIAPMAFLLLAILRFMQGARLTNYQFRLAQTIFVWLVASIIFIMISDQNSPAVYLVLVPPIAFYISHYFVMKNRGFLAEFSFALFAGLCVATYFFASTDSWLKAYYDDSHYLVKKEAYPALEGKKVLVLAENLNPYYKAQQTTPFLSWQLSEPVFNQLNYYDNLTIIYDGITKGRPEVIIDPQRVMPDVFDMIPALQNLYKTNSDGTYRLIESAGDLPNASGMATSLK